MFIQKNNIFLELTKNQKSFLVSYLKNYTKKNEANSTSEILYSFIDDETYYFEIGNPHFEWIIPMLEQQKFLDELKCLIAQYKFQLEQKERQRPFLEKQKEFAKRERKKQQEYKLSKELPTEKQIKYYNSLCKKYSVEKKSLDNLSKLDLKNMISNIIDENEKEVYKCLDKD